MKTQDLIAEAVTLPPRERMLIVDSLLRSIDPPKPEIDRKWTALAQRRLLELRSGDVEAVPGEEVFEKIWEKFSK